MYFSKISLRRDTDSLNNLNHFINKNGYYYHQLIWNLFSENNPTKSRDFIYRAEFYKSWPSFYTISNTEPVDMKGIWEISTKNFQPKIRIGDFLYFKLRANPRVCRKHVNKKHTYFDVVQDRLYQKKISGEIRESKSEIIQAAGENWLNSRSESNGFIVTPKNIIIDNFQKHRFQKTKHANIISFSTIDFSGQLKILDPEKFLQTLCKGIGAAKGFGCGLLMVKR